MRACPRCVHGLLKALLGLCLCEVPICVSGMTPCYAEVRQEHLLSKDLRGVFNFALLR